MNIVIMNMVRILKDNQVVVLNKKKKEGWEGLTFPGGKVEPNESFIDSAKREVKEETNLDIEDLEFDGIIQWINNSSRWVGLLYTSKNVKGELVKENREGNLYYQDYEEFKKDVENHSDSMEFILPIYDKKYSEIVLTYDENNKLIGKKYF